MDHLLRYFQRLLEPLGAEVFGQLDEHQGVKGLRDRAGEPIAILPVSTGLIFSIRAAELVALAVSKNRDAH
jgi:hypothetical protein